MNLKPATIDPAEERQLLETAAASLGITYTLPDGSPAELCWECTGAGRSCWSYCKVCRGTGLLPLGTFDKLRPESHQETDRTKIAHRWRLIAGNLEDMEALADPQAAELWRSYVAKFRELVNEATAATNKL